MEIRIGPKLGNLGISKKKKIADSFSSFFVIGSMTVEIRGESISRKQQR